LLSKSTAIAPTKTRVMMRNVTESRRAVYARSFG
jgi:hypothetical protein